YNQRMAASKKPAPAPEPTPEPTPGGDSESPDEI
ncbi:hemagglutinin, partial [Parabacteroides distasonis]|nr:hemagglutinin [Parabacteroides distasonis]